MFHVIKGSTVLLIFVHQKRQEILTVGLMQLQNKMRKMKKKQKKQIKKLNKKSECYECAAVDMLVVPRRPMTHKF